MARAIWSRSLNSSRGSYAPPGKLGKKGYPLSGVYRRIQDKELFLAAYGKLYANSGATTAGIDPEDTVDGMSIERIEKILQQLHDGRYQWKPVRRVHIPKTNGKQRPLGIPSWSDKLLQEVIRMVLEAYYEPRFSSYSHGFRPHRSCHTLSTLPGDSDIDSRQ